LAYDDSAATLHVGRSFNVGFFHVLRYNIANVSETIQIDTVCFDVSTHSIISCNTAIPEASAAVIG
jgi:hypothetical protein